jgi:protein-S-isoprenylcysteine O-methyltransferase Ste14
MRWIPFALFVACYASFSWAMAWYFQRPQRSNSKVATLAVAGSVGILMHGYCLWNAQGPGFPGLGCVLYLASLFLFWAAWQASRADPLKWAFHPEGHHSFLTSGPYRFVRHPFYASYILAWAAGVVARPSWWTAVPLLGMTFLYVQAAGGEEAHFLHSESAQAYKQYQQSTGMFWPRPSNRQNGI